MSAFIVRLILANWTSLLHWMRNKNEVYLLVFILLNTRYKLFRPKSGVNIKTWPPLEYSIQTVSGSQILINRFLKSNTDT